MPEAVGICHLYRLFYRCHLLFHGLSWWLSGKASVCQCRRHRRHWFDPWVWKIPLRRKWQLTPVFLPGKSLGQRSLAGSSPWGCKELDTTEQLSTHTHSLCSRHDVFGLKKQNSISNYDVETQSTIWVIFQQRKPCMLLWVLPSSLLAGSYLHPQAFPFVHLFCCQILN